MLIVANARVFLLINITILTNRTSVLNFHLPVAHPICITPSVSSKTS
jgi:hypothetical protein